VSVWIGLLRAVNLGSRKLTSADLKTACEDAGLENVRTLLASGNVVFEAKGTAAKIETALEAAVKAKVGFDAEAMVRSPKQWAAILEANPFPKQAKKDPAHLIVWVMKDQPDLAVLDVYLKAYDGPELVEPGDRALYIYYPESQARSDFKLPRKTGIGTGRNWNTMQKLAAMADS
jgi:uncharacterized protein (DUF1697 family)